MSHSGFSVLYYFLRKELIVHVGNKNHILLYFNKVNSRPWDNTSLCVNYVYVLCISDLLKEHEQ